MLIGNLDLVEAAQILFSLAGESKKLRPSFRGLFLWFISELMASRNIHFNRVTSDASSKGIAIRRQAPATEQLKNQRVKC